MFEAYPHGRLCGAAASVTHFAVASAHPACYKIFTSQHEIPSSNIYPHQSHRQAKPFSLPRRQYRFIPPGKLKMRKYSYAREIRRKRTYARPQRKDTHDSAKRRKRSKNLTARCRAESKVKAKNRVAREAHPAKRNKTAALVWRSGRREAAAADHIGREPRRSDALIGKQLSRLRSRPARIEGIERTGKPPDGKDVARWLRLCCPRTEHDRVGDIISYF